jgi:stearoyl-CoA desaturase (delta-9 desaturase)
MTSMDTAQLGGKTGAGKAPEAAKAIDGTQPFFDLKTAGYNWFNIIWLAFLHLMGLVALVKIGMNFADQGALMSWEVFWWSFGSWLLTGLGITLGYHRGGTHGGFRSTWFIEACWLYLGGCAVQGDYYKWRYTHTIHHMFTDIAGKDPHTSEQFPGQPWKGFWWSHMGWMLRDLKLPEPPVTFPPSKLVDLQRKKWVYITIAVSSFMVPFVATGFSIDALLIAGFLRVLMSFHYTACINSVAHFWGEQLEAYKERRIKVKATNETKTVVVTARNVWLWLGLFVLSLGESFHNNHHKIPSCVRHGLSKAQVDITYACILVLSWLRLIRDVKWMEVPRARLLADEAKTRAEIEITAAKANADAVMGEAEEIVWKAARILEKAEARGQAAIEAAEADLREAVAKEEAKKAAEKADSNLTSV